MEINEDNDDKLVTILKSNNLYQHLYELLTINDIDINVLKNDIQTKNIDQTCDDLELKGMKRVRFRKLIRIIHEKNEEKNLSVDKHESDIKLKKFLIDNKLPLKLYNVLLNEGVNYDKLVYLSPSNVDSLWTGRNIRIGTQIDFDDAIKKLKQKEGVILNEKKYDEKPNEIHYDNNNIQFLQPHHKMKIVLIGDSFVGKTNLMNRYVCNKFNESFHPNFHFDYMKKNEQLSDDSIMQIEIWDTAGQERYNSICSTYYHKADAIMVCFDITNQESLENCTKWRQQIEKYAKDDVIIILVGCKADELTDENIEGSITPYNYATNDQFSSVDSHVLKIIDQPEWENYSKTFCTLYCKCSAKTGTNVRTAFLNAAELVLPKKMIDYSLSNRAEYVDLKPKQEISYRCCVSLI
eukprot:194092_1